MYSTDFSKVFSRLDQIYKRNTHSKSQQKNIQYMKLMTHSLLNKSKTLKQKTLSVMIKRCETQVPEQIFPSQRRYKKKLIISNTTSPTKSFQRSPPLTLLKHSSPTFLKTWQDCQVQENLFHNQMLKQRLKSSINSNIRQKQIIPLVLMNCDIPLSNGQISKRKNIRFFKSNALAQKSSSNTQSQLFEKNYMRSILAKNLAIMAHSYNNEE